MGQSRHFMQSVKLSASLFSNFCTDINYIEEPLPLVGGMIIASNHYINSDPVLLGFVAEKAQTVL
mgnify:CR=1 FL=1